MAHFSQVNELSSRLAEVQPPAANRLEAEMLQSADAGLVAAARVSDEFLDGLHPDLRFHFREEPVRGNREYIAGIREKDALQQIRAIRLMNRWYEGFWLENHEAIVTRAFGPEE